MSTKQLHAVTGAFGYSGKYITRRLLAQGQQVITLTNSIDRQNEFNGRVPAHPFNFDQPEKLAASLQGVTVLYNTYWVRFNHKTFKHADAVQNSIILFNAAKEAGVERIVHVSITNPDENSPLEYFQGKAVLERALQETGLSYAILRPTVLFGKEDILINNITWMVRQFPVFGVFGDGQYRMQPIHVDDLAKLAVEQGHGRDNIILNAIGPETFTYRHLIQTIGQAIGKNRPIISMPPWLGLQVSKLVGRLVDDVLITPEEIEGLMADLLAVDAPPTGTTRLTNWVQQYAATLGQTYTSELARRRNRQAAYASN
ncbi:MAG: NAD(P)H-binding protein [Chloroflexi bacterium]|nr:NAD(P)H-binding protein [Chloroflexota bacterium]